MSAKPLRNKAVKDLYETLASGRMDTLSEEDLSIERMIRVMPNNDTPLHASARSGVLPNLPACILRHQYLQIPGLDGQTVYHVALSSGCFDALPSHLHTEDMLLLKDATGVAFVVEIAKRGMLPVVHRPALTNKVMSAMDLEGNNVLMLAAQTDTVHCVPDALISYDLIASVNRDSRNVFDYLEDDDFQKQRIESLVWSR